MADDVVVLLSEYRRPTPVIEEQRVEGRVVVVRNQRTGAHRVLVSIEAEDDEAISDADLFALLRRGGHLLARSAHAHEFKIRKGSKS